MGFVEGKGIGDRGRRAGRDRDLLVIDPARPEQVLYSYLSNALKFTGEGGCVMLRATGEGDRVRIEVEDTGAGIAADDVKRLFADDQPTAAGARVGGRLRGAAQVVISKGHGGNARVVEALAAVLPHRPTVEVADGR